MKAGVEWQGDGAGVVHGQPDQQAARGSGIERFQREGKRILRAGGGGIREAQAQ